MCMVPVAEARLPDLGMSLSSFEDGTLSGLAEASFPPLDAMTFFSYL